MERYYSDDDDEKDEPFFDTDDDDDDGDGEETIAYIDNDDMITVMQMELARTELNQKLLDRAILLAEKAWFWQFRSNEYKTKQISRIYQNFLSLTESNRAEEETTEED